MRAGPGLFLLVAATGAAQAVTIPSYAVDVDMAAGGAAQVRLQVQVEQAETGTLLLPLGFRPAGAVQLESAPAGAQMRLVSVGERQHLELRLPDGVPPSFTATARMALAAPPVVSQEARRGRQALPAGSRRFDHAFVNTQPVAVGSYRVRLVLPDGERVHRVIEQSPRLRGNETEPRVALFGAEGRQGAVLQASALAIGDRTAMAVEVIRDERPAGWFWVGLALAAGWLFGFRDLVSRREA